LTGYTDANSFTITPALSAVPLLAARGDLARLRRCVAMLAIDCRDVVVAGENELRDGVPVQVRDVTLPMRL
jgi:hypothetical protein